MLNPFCAHVLAGYVVVAGFVTPAVTLGLCQVHAVPVLQDMLSTTRLLPFLMKRWQILT